MGTIASSIAPGIGTGTIDTSFRPVPAAQRIDFLDALRGFALIGILLMNIEWFNRPWAWGGTITADLQGKDHLAGQLVNIFVDGKFVALFSLLFGIGFAIMLERAIERGRPFSVVYLRRLLALGIFGVLHGIFLWYGDILLAYAIGGLFLMAWVWLLHRPRLRRFDNPDSILRFALGYLLLPVVLASAFGAVNLLSQDTSELRTVWQEQLAVADQPGEPVGHAGDEATQHAAWTSPSFTVVLEQRMRQWRDFLRVIPWQILMGVLPLFMLGYWLVRSGRVREVARHRDFYRTSMYAGIGLGLPMSIASVALEAHAAALDVTMLATSSIVVLIVASSLLAAGYLGLIVTMSLSTTWRRPLMWLAPMGRMALTNYVMQSLIASLVFYGYGLGQYGNIGRGSQMLLVAAILVFQCVFSALWLKAFRFGPLEWLWRCFTYWRWQPMRSAGAVPAG